MFTLRFRLIFIAIIAIASGVAPTLVHYIGIQFNLTQSYTEMNWTDYAYFGLCYVVIAFVGFGMAILVWIPRKSSNEKEEKLTGI